MRENVIGDAGRAERRLAVADGDIPPHAVVRDLRVILELRRSLHRRAPDVVLEQDRDPVVARAAEEVLERRA